MTPATGLVKHVVIFFWHGTERREMVVYKLIAVKQKDGSFKVWAVIDPDFLPTLVTREEEKKLPRKHKPYIHACIRTPTHTGPAASVCHSSPLPLHRLQFSQFIAPPSSSPPHSLI